MSMSEEKPMTHIAWARHFRRGIFCKWVQVGEARIDVDSNGQPAAHVYHDRTVRGDTGYTCLIPIGVQPPDPPPKPQRPAQSEAEEDF